MEITAQEGNGTVVICGTYVDENWVSPADYVSEDGVWLYYEGHAGYTVVEGMPHISFACG